MLCHEENRFIKFLSKSGSLSVTDKQTVCFWSLLTSRSVTDNLADRDG